MSSFFRRRRGPERIAPVRRNRPWRPQAEALEGRVVLATFLVTNPSDNLLPGSLRYAITEANLPGNGGSTVEITPQVAGPIDLTLGELFIANNMMIRNDSGAPLEIHQSTPDSAVFHMNAPSVTITGVSSAAPITIDGGSAPGGDGGGIAEDNASSILDLSYVDVAGNSATAVGTNGGLGGGVYSAGQVTLDHGAVGSNAAEQGGGVYAAGGVSLTASSVDGNKATGTSGGIVVVHGDLTLTSGSAVNSNSAHEAGGISVTQGNVNVGGGSHVDDNSAHDVAGIMEGQGAVTVSGGSTVDSNSSDGGHPPDPATGDFGGGGIAVIDGRVTVDDGQVNDNQTVGMYSGGIVILLGDVTVTDGGQVDRNTNNGPGGGIAANFDGHVTVSGGSQVDDNTAAAIGGGIVNFSGGNGSVTVSGGSQVDGNVLTNRQTIGGAVAVFLETIVSHLPQIAATMPGSAGGALSGTVQVISQAVAPLLGLIKDAVSQVDAHGVMVAGGGIGTLLTCPISVTGGSEVDANIAGLAVAGGTRQVAGLGGGIFSVFSQVDIEQSAVEGNTATSSSRLGGKGGGIFSRYGRVTIDVGTFRDNTATGDGGGLWDGLVTIVSGSTISENSSGRGGGGMYVAPGAVAYVTDTTFQGNEAVVGGGIDDHGIVVLIGCTVTDNSATRKGGGINDAGRLILINTTVDGNSPNDISGRGH